MTQARAALIPALLALSSGLASCALRPSVTAGPRPTELPSGSPSAVAPSATSRRPALAYTPPGLYPTREPGSTYPPQRQWADVLGFTPFPYSTPLPPSDPSPIDGLYGMLDPGEPQWWRCARCPDFRPAGGVWRLQFDSGIMRLFYEVTGFATASSFAVDGDRLVLFNDPHCLYDVGEYTWQLQSGSLILTEVHDDCAIHLRAVNLTRPGWLSCPPPDAAGAAADKPPGCD